MITFLLSIGVIIALFFFALCCDEADFPGPVVAPSLRAFVVGTLLMAIVGAIVIGVLFWLTYQHGLETAAQWRVR